MDSSAFSNEMLTNILSFTFSLKLVVLKKMGYSVKNAITSNKILNSIGI